MQQLRDGKMTEEFVFVRFDDKMTVADVCAYLITTLTVQVRQTIAEKRFCRVGAFLPQTENNLLIPLDVTLKELGLPVIRLCMIKGCM